MAAIRLQSIVLGRAKPDVGPKPAALINQSHAGRQVRPDRRTGRITGDGRCQQRVRAGHGGGMSVQVAAQGGADVAELAAASGEPSGQHPLYVEVVLVGGIRVLSRRRDEALPSSYGGSRRAGRLVGRAVVARSDSPWRSV